MEVEDVRIRGARGVLEVHDPLDMESVQSKCVERGVWIRPFGRLVYTMPQYIITDSQLRKLCDTMVRIVSETQQA